MQETADILSRLRFNRRPLTAANEDLAGHSEPPEVQQTRSSPRG